MPLEILFYRHPPSTHITITLVMAISDKYVNIVPHYICLYIKIYIEAFGYMFDYISCSISGDYSWFNMGLQQFLSYLYLFIDNFILIHKYRSSCIQMNDFYELK